MDFPDHGCPKCGGIMVDAGPRQDPAAPRYYHLANRSPLCPPLAQLVELELGYFDGPATATVDSLGEQIDHVRKALLLIARHLSRRQA